MSEAPKKIWLRWGRKVSLLPGQIATKTDEDTPYIRADIVGELVEALKGLQVWTSLAIHNEYVKPMIEDALAKLEESHE